MTQTSMESSVEIPFIMDLMKTYFVIDIRESQSRDILIFPSSIHLLSFLNCENIRVFHGRTVYFIRNWNNILEMWVNLIAASIALTLTIVSFPFWYRGKKMTERKRKKRAYNGINERTLLSNYTENLLCAHEFNYARLTKCVAKNYQYRQR